MSDRNPFYAGTFADRKAIREGKTATPETKQVDDESAEVEDKAVAKKTTSRKTAKS